jgi:hypothetical protein
MAAKAKITVDARKVIQRVGPYMRGTCIEDVNHEVYGGIYSQMIFGESFQECRKERRIGEIGNAKCGTRNMKYSYLSYTQSHAVLRGPAESMDSALRNPHSPFRHISL